MTNFTYWEEKLYVQTGKYMCILCFGVFEKDELHKGKDGLLEDVCTPCWEHEDKEMKKRGLR